MARHVRVYIFPGGTPQPNGSGTGAAGSAGVFAGAGAAHECRGGARPPGLPGRCRTGAARPRATRDGCHV